MRGRTLDVIALDEQGYRAASFLDDRLLAQAGPPLAFDWDQAAQAAAGLARDCDLIFHTGHVGSTLLARLLGASSRVFAVREPAILRPLAAPDAQAVRGEALDVLMGLLSRVWRAPQRSLVKATSFVSEIGPEMMSLLHAPRAILMFAAPHVYVAGILGGESSMRELSALSPARLARLRRRTGGDWRLEDMRPGERAAMGWACELLALAAIAERSADRALWVDFDELLADLRPGLARILAHLHDEPDPSDLAAMLSSPDLRRYSKQTEHAYDAALRHAVITDGLHRFRDEVGRGMAWLNRLGADCPPFAAAARAAVAGARA